MASPRMKEMYQTEAVPSLIKEFGFGNAMAVPTVKKITVNTGIGRESQTNAKAIDAAVGDLATITGQKPIVTKARKSIAQFKLREGNSVGIAVTLRGERMWEFLDRFISIALPRIRDFQGVSADSFDGRGNYSVGLREQLVFPEIEYDQIDRVRGLQVNIITNARNDVEGKSLLKALGMPFRG
jgi:large subunit ribosomal protein L5